MKAANILDNVVYEVTNDITVQENIISMQTRLDGLAGYSLETLIKEILDSAISNSALVFIANTHLVSNAYNFWPRSGMRAAVSNVLKDKGYNDADLLTILNLLTGTTLSTQLPLDIAKKVVSVSEYNALRKIKAKATFDTNAKNLNLDSFSYKTFEAFILKNKKMTGIDATRYMDILSNTSSYGLDENKLKIKNMYIKLIWDNVKTKSIQLSASIIQHSNYSSKGIDMPFAIMYDTCKKPESRWAEEVTASIYFFISAANKYNIPHSLGQYSESAVHRYITGIPKSKKMSRDDVLYALEKIRILIHLVEVDTTKCPYYQQLLDQLIGELSEDKNKELFLSLADMSPVRFITAKKTLDTITAISNSYK